MVEKVRDRAARLVSGLNPARRAAELVKGWGDRLWALLPGGIREKLPWLEGKLVFIPVGLVLVFIVFLMILAMPGMPDRPAAGAEVFKAAPIPPEDLFLPEEPDFLPPVILERERREVWTEEDAEPFWYRPLEDGEEVWREQVEKVIDDLLERVP
jgi:hypothetical protein